MVEFRNLTKRRINYAVYKKLYKKIFSKRKRFALSLVFAPPSLMKKLNREYRGKNKEANVLSFTYEKGSGEVFLNIREKELPFLFVHGCLHLLGYDHKKNKDSESMEKLEKQILKK